jgi:hypothetical protein
MKEFLLGKWDALAKFLSVPPLPLPFWERLPADAQGCIVKTPQFTQIDRFSCGFVAGWAVIKTLHPEHNPWDARSFYASCDPDVERGTSASRLAKALRTHGIRVGLRSGQIAFSLLKKALENGSPVIACIDRPNTDYLHWVTVYGYSETQRSGEGRRSVYLHNNGLPLPWCRGDRVMEFERFQKLQLGGDFLICGRKSGEGKRRARESTRSMHRGSSMR